MMNSKKKELFIQVCVNRIPKIALAHVFLDQNHIQIRPKNVNFSQKVMQIIGFYSQG
jgi:hypothetical protein